jgi:alkyl sulfatase BDS1-like metallo-beta-lactamase superfamily hydrolase
VVNAQYLQGHSFSNTADFEDAQRGLIAQLPELVIIGNTAGVPVWDLTQYAFRAPGSKTTRRIP